jgi:hypothetical protein
MGSGVDPSRPSLKVGFEVSNILITRHHGVQCKASGQSIAAGIADLSLPIPLAAVHCPYCRQERFYFEQDRIDFDTENGLPLKDRSDLVQCVGWTRATACMGRLRRCPREHGLRSLQTTDEWRAPPDMPISPTMSRSATTLRGAKVAEGF